MEEGRLMAEDDARDSQSGSLRSASSTRTNNRESIYDALFEASPAQRRLAPYTNAGGFGGSGKRLPYVLHTTDEYPLCYPANALGVNTGALQSPSHAIAFRTVDNTVIYPDASGRNIYGGAKLGMYTYWIPGTTWPNVASGAPPQFEFYDYYPPTNNYGELNNDAFNDAGAWQATSAGVYVNSFNNIMAAELYYLDPKIQNASYCVQRIHGVSQHDCQGLWSVHWGPANGKSKHHTLAVASLLMF